MFDILFRNAKVIDGTGNPWFYGDVGVEGGTVAAVLPPGSTARARRVADVDGKALCPGFVDGHSHSELPLLAGEGMDCKIMQGVTTENLGLDGMSLAPIKDGDKADWKKHLSGLAGTLDVPWTWNSFAEYLDCLQAAKPPLNVSSYVGLGTVRLSVMGMADRPAEDHEIRAMRDLVARCMDEGARGISAGLIYPPSRYQSLEETVAVAKAAAVHGGIYDVHMRNEADAIAESVEEVIAISERSGIPAMITHFKIRGKKNWGRSAALIRRIDEARAAGIAALDTVYSDVNNEEGFLAEAMLIKKLGFDGKSVINPRQIEPLHRVFMPSEKDLNKARLIMAAIEEANARGSGVASLKGKMIDKPVVTRARRLLDLYEAGSKIDEVEEI